MASPLDRLKEYFTAPIFPPVVLGFSRTRVSGVLLARKEERIASHFVLSLPAGCLEPSFDQKNILDAPVLEGVLRRGSPGLGPVPDGIALLIPETCTRLFVLTFESLPSSPAEREEIFQWRLNKLVPLKPGELRISSNVIRSGNQAKVILAAARVSVIQEYESLMERLGMKVRAIGVPAFNLLGLVRLEPPGHAVLVNVEEDYVSLLAVLGGEASLYRLKPFLQEADGPEGEGRRMDQVVNEIENTVNFIEDREKKKVQSLWVRAVVGRPEADVLSALRERLPALKINGFASPWPVPSQDLNILSPLIGQLA